MSENWDAIRKALPIRKTPEDFARRNEIWACVDVNGNGYVSVAELDKGLADVMQNQELFKSKPAILRAHTAAKNKVKTKSSHGADYVERCEFRLVLLYLRQYFEYWIAFKRVDDNDDDRISLEEFIDAQEEIEKWVGKIDAEEAFKEIDTNGGGMILFNEFVRWATKKSLDLEDDDDYDNQG